MSANEYDNHSCCNTSSCRWTQLFRCFRIAINPSRLFPALLMVLVLYIAGRVMDGIGFGDRVWPNEIQTYIEAGGDGQAFDDWTKSQEVKAKAGRASLITQWNRKLSTDELAELVSQSNWQSLAIEQINQGKQAKLKVYSDLKDEALETQKQLIEKEYQQTITDLAQNDKRGVFAATLDFKLTKFNQIMKGMIDPAILTNAQARQNLITPIVEMFTLPCWLWHAHPVFFIIWLFIGLVVWSQLGGTLSRLTMMEVTQGKQISLNEAMAFAKSRWLSYLLAPVLPLVVVGLIGLFLAGGGMACFQWVGNIPGIGFIGDLVGVIFFVIALLLGFLMAIMLVGWTFGVHFMYPSIASEGTDAFDAISRSFSYVFAKPWRVLGYGFVSLVYGAATYLFVGLIVFLTLKLTQGAISCFDGGFEVNRFDAMMPPPQLGELTFSPDYGALNWSGKVAAVFILVMAYLVIAVVAAYAISFYFACTSTVYLLLRYQCDGVEMGQCFTEPDDSVDASVGKADKVEPTEKAEVGDATDTDATASSDNTDNTDNTDADNGDSPKSPPTTSPDQG